VLSSFEHWSIEREELMYKTKPYEISKDIVQEAFQRVKENKGSAGVDD
jgi:RNA-directed DNA polymerase